MDGGHSLALLSLPAPAVSRISQPAIRDVTQYFDPELVAIPGPREPTAEASVREATAETPVIHPQLGRAGESIVHYRHTPETGVHTATDASPPSDAIDVIAVQNSDILSRLASQLEDDERATGGDAATVVIVPRYSIEWDSTTLSTELPHRDDLAAIQATLPEPVVVLAGEQPADYAHRWEMPHDRDTITVPVAGMGATDRSGPTVAQLRCSARGSVTPEAVDAEQFGLRSLEGVGQSTAARLREAGCSTVRDVRNLAVSDLATLQGIGRSTAEQIHAHADVVESGEPLVLTNKTPVTTRDDRPPICLDIETDGLTPTIIWQFGVYDPATDRYRSFLEDETPTDPEPILDAFVTWFLANHDDRTVLTWNGDGFDYPCIERFLRRYRPAYLEAWTDVWTADLYTWAVRDGNALLPGRTNKLDHVARALGYDSAGTGLSGAQTAAAYQRFMRNPDSPSAEPAWDRHVAYCEDDCRALWHVYRAIRDAPRRDVTDSGTGGAVGTQAGLTDF